MKRLLMLSELVKLGQELLAKHGNVRIFQEDMEELTLLDIEVVESKDPERHGKRFVHFGKW